MTSTTEERRAQGERHPPLWVNSTYHPRLSIRMVMPRKGHVSTSNAGVRANPTDVPPSRPSSPGMTHHQGRGSSPLNMATNGFSTCRNLSIVFSNTFIHYKGSYSHFRLIHLGHLVALDILRVCVQHPIDKEFQPDVRLRWLPGCYLRF